jgi:hypothetical protein
MQIQRFLKDMPADHGRGRQFVSQLGALAERVGFDYFPYLIDFKCEVLPI